jgi:predicted ester cyclase
MSTLTIDTREFIEGYFEAMTSQPKTEDLLNQYISDASLKEHIRQAETAFPGYQIIRHQVVAEGDMVAVRGTVQGVHKGEFAGIAPTGKRISADLMIFYRVTDGRIVEHWMQWDVKSVMDQLTN